MSQSFTERSLVVLKPDALERNLVGEIIGRIERVGLKVVEAKLVKQVSRELASEHYPVTDEWLEKVGKNTLDDCVKYDIDPIETIGTDSPKEAGKIIHNFNKEYLTSGPVLAMVIEGPHAIELIRKLAGHTVPVLSAPGTIRGDLSFESAVYANASRRSIKNLIHASGNREEAEREIKLWFGEG